MSMHEEDQEIKKLQTQRVFESLFTTVKSVSEGKCLEAHRVVGEKLDSSVILKKLTKLLFLNPHLLHDRYI